MKSCLLISAAITALAAASGANAAITIMSGSFGTSGGVHSTPGLSSPTVTGTVNGGDLVTLTSSTDVIDTSGGGESVFAADDGSLQQITVNFSHAYDQVTFDIFKPTNNSTSWTLAVNGSPLNVSGFSPLTQNANKFIVAGNGTGISSLNFSFASGAQDLREIRVQPLAASVPEPATWALMILGVGAAGAVLRRRRERIGPRIAA